MAPRIAERIIDAAAGLFAEKGFRATTTREIADRAGVDESSIFRIFKSKQRLSSEALLHTAQQRIPLHEFDRMVNKGDFERAMRKTLRKLFRWYTSDFVRMVTYALLEQNGHLADAFLRDHVYPGFGSISNRIKQEQAQGRLVSVKPDAATRAIIFPLFYHAMFHYFRADRVRELKVSTRDVNVYIDLWLRSLKRAKDRRSPRRGALSRLRG